MFFNGAIQVAEEIKSTCMYEEDKIKQKKFYARVNCKQNRLSVDRLSLAAY